MQSTLKISHTLQHLCQKKFSVLASNLSIISWKDFYLTHKCMYNWSRDSILTHRSIWWHLGCNEHGQNDIIQRFQDSYSWRYGQKQTIALLISLIGDFLGSYQCVRGNTPIASGVCYWEVQVDKLKYVAPIALTTLTIVTVPTRRAFMLL